MRGYSLELMQANRAASATNIGVKLGRLCIKRNVPVSSVAVHCKVSRATIYNWFKGTIAPAEKNVDAVKTLLAQLTNS